MSLARVVIAIQAKTASPTYPGKVFERLGDKTVLEHVVASCFQSAEYINRNAGRSRAFVMVALCVPLADEIAARYDGPAELFEGPDEDVLSRYALLGAHLKADYVVRVMGDCPLLPAFVITKHIMTAIMNEYDYVSNVDEKCRTAADGWDCEVISRRLLEHTAERASDTGDRENVTTLIRRDPPPWIRRGMVINFVDLSTLKLTLDTPEDMDRLREQYAKVLSALAISEATYGKSHTHRF